MSTNGTTELQDLCIRLGYTVKLMWTIIAPFITVGGLLSNMTVIVAFRHPRFLKSSPMLHLFILAISDCVVLSIGPVRDWAIHTLDYDIKDTSDFVCKTSYFVLYVSLDFTSWILASITIERAYGILKPIESRGMFTVKRAKVTLSVIFVVLSTFNVHFFFTNGLKPVEGRLKCTSLTDEYLFFEDFVFVWIDLCLVALFPFCIMFTCNWLIITFLRSKYDKQYRCNSTVVFRNAEQSSLDDLSFRRETKISEIELYIHPDDAAKVSESPVFDGKARETRLDSDWLGARHDVSIEMSPNKPETSAANTVKRRGSKTSANKKAPSRKKSREQKPLKRKSRTHEPVRKRSKSKNLPAKKPPVQKTPARKSPVRESTVRKKRIGSDKGVSTQQNRTTVPTITECPINAQLISVKVVSSEIPDKVLDADPIQTENKEINQNNKRILNVINTYETQSEATPKNLDDTYLDAKGRTSQHTAHVLHHEGRMASVSQDKLDTSTSNVDIPPDAIKSKNPQTEFFLSRIYEFSSNLIRSLFNIRPSRPQRSSNSKQYNQEIVSSVSRSLFMMTLIFWMTTMPFALYLVMSPFLRDEEETCTRANAILDVVRASTSMLMYVNSGANVFLYATCSPVFRSELHQMFGFYKKLSFP